MTNKKDAIDTIEFVKNILEAHKNDDIYRQASEIVKAVTEFREILADANRVVDAIDAGKVEFQSVDNLVDLIETAYDEDKFPGMGRTEAAVELLKGRIIHVYGILPSEPLPVEIESEAKTIDEYRKRINREIRDYFIEFGKKRYEFALNNADFIRNIGLELGSRAWNAALDKVSEKEETIMFYAYNTKTNEVEVKIPITSVHEIPQAFKEAIESYRGSNNDKRVFEVEVFNGEIRLIRIDFEHNIRRTNMTAVFGICEGK